MVSHQPPGKQVHVLMVLMESVIRRLPNSLFLVEESMAGHVGVNRVY
jgi:hypothetical protein